MVACPPPPIFWEQNFSSLEGSCSLHKSFRQLEHTFLLVLSWGTNIEARCHCQPCSLLGGSLEQRLWYHMAEVVEAGNPLYVFGCRPAFSLSCGPTTSPSWPVHLVDGHMKLPIGLSLLELVSTFCAERAFNNIPDKHNIGTLINRRVCGVSRDSKIEIKI